MTKDSKTEALNSFKTEADLLKTLDNQNIVQFKYFKEYFN